MTANHNFATSIESGFFKKTKKNNCQDKTSLTMRLKVTIFHINRALGR